MSRARPYGAWCYVCSIRKCFTSETDRQRWINKHADELHADRKGKQDVSVFIGKYEQQALDI